MMLYAGKCLLVSWYIVFHIVVVGSFDCIFVRLRHHGYISHRSCSGEIEQVRFNPLTGHVRSQAFSVEGLDMSPLSMQGLQLVISGGRS